jgi:hypothetical protein
MDKRIGTYSADGQIETWPQTDINGATYSRPATLHNLDAARFVVLPTGFNEWDTIAALKAELDGTPPAPPAPETTGAGDVTPVTRKRRAE